MVYALRGRDGGVGEGEGGVEGRKDVSALRSEAIGVKIFITSHAVL
jgi:hypothetical protein